MKLRILMTVFLVQMDCRGAKVTRTKHCDYSVHKVLDTNTVIFFQQYSNENEGSVPILFDLYMQSTKSRNVLVEVYLRKKARCDRNADP